MINQCECLHEQVCIFKKDLVGAFSKIIVARYGCNELPAAWKDYYNLIQRECQYRLPERKVNPVSAIPLPAMSYLPILNVTKVLSSGTDATDICLWPLEF